MDHQHHCCHTAEAPIRLGKNLKITGTIFIGIFALSYLPFLERFNDSLVSYISLIWWAVLLGLLLGGIIDHFVPDGFIFKYLGQRKKRTLFNAAIAGFLLSACSHGILAISIQLYKKRGEYPGGDYLPARISVGQPPDDGAAVWRDANRNNNGIHLRHT